MGKYNGTIGISTMTFAIPLARLQWILFQRTHFMRTIEGFWSHWNTWGTGNLEFHKYNRIYKGSYLYNVKLGKCTYVAGGKVSNTEIGSYSSIGPDTLLGGLGKHPTKLLSTHPAFYSSEKKAGISFQSVDSFAEFSNTLIGNDVWIGARAMVLDGITIGDGAIVAAGAIVTKDIPPYALAAGVPAKIIRYRFPDNVISELLGWKWWNLPFSVLQKLSEDFSSEESCTINRLRQIINKTEELS